MAKFIDVHIKADFSKLRSRSQRQQLLLKRLPKEFEKVVVEETPIDSGHARRNTRLQNSNNGNGIIRSNYAYARRLNEGWSKQAPQGFVKPALEWLNNRINEIFGKRGR